MTYLRVLALVLCCFTASHSYSETPTTEQIYSNPNTYTNSIGISVGVQQALSQQGIILHGIDYGYEVTLGPNQTNTYCTNWVLFVCTATRTVTTLDTHIGVTGSLTDADGNIIASHTANWWAQRNWTSGRSSLTLPADGVLYRDLGTFNLNFSLTDDTAVRNIWANGIWVYDPCYLDPLSSPTCPGYAAAYAAKQVEEMAAQQMEEPVLEITPTETISSTTPSETVSGGTTDNGSSSGDTESVSAQETADKENDNKSKLALAQSLDAANNFDLSSVTGGASNPDEDLANDILGAAEAAAADTVANLTQSSIESSSRQEESQNTTQQELQTNISGMDQLGGMSNGMAVESNQAQDTMGMDTIQTEVQSSLASTQVASPVETRQERRERLKEITEDKANEISEENADADSMDEQTKQQTEQLALMNYVPGFDTYQTFLPGGVYPDVPFYKPTTVPESKRGLRNGLAQQLLHDKMVQMQYERGQ